MAVIEADSEVEDSSFNFRRRFLKLDGEGDEFFTFSFSSSLLLFQPLQREREPVVEPACVEREKSFCACLFFLLRFSLLPLESII